MPITSSPNMSLPIPVVGTEPGPTYAQDVNDSLTIIDSHDHSSGLGVQITPSGLNINADLPVGGNNLTTIRSSRFSSQGSPLAGVNDKGCIYESGVDLYYNDGNGVQIRLTQAGSIVGSTGSITGLVAPASASYSGAGSKFTWQSDVNTAATMDCGSVIVRELVTSGFGVTLAAPSLTGDITLTLPVSVGSASSLLQSNGTGALAFVAPPNNNAFNYSLATSVATNAMTITLKGSDGNALSSSNVATLIYRNATLTTGTPVPRRISGPISVTVPSGATLGNYSAVNQFIYVYALDNAGTTELAVAGTPFADESTLQSTVALSGSSTAAMTLYSTTSRSSVAVRLLGRVISAETTAGTYASNATEISSAPAPMPIVTDWRSDLSFTFTGLGTPTNVNIWYRRMGDSMEVRGSLNSGTATGVTLVINLPSGFTVDYNKLPTAAAGIHIGSVIRAGSNDPIPSGNAGPYVVITDGSTTNAVFMSGLVSATQVFNKAQANNFFASGDLMSMQFSFPVAEWASTR